MENYGRKALEAVGGPYLDDITALATRAFELGLYVPQIRMRRRRDGLPHRAAYAIRLDQVLRRRVHTAADVRSFCGVPSDAHLVLLCFADDGVLEDFWDDESRFRAVAEGGWDLVTAPSYSLWYRRPRTLHFHAIKRSYLCFEALQMLGAQAVPRVEFIDRRDVEIQADWFNANPHVEIASVDWMTCRQDADFVAGAVLLAAFDRESGNRLRYMINGTTVFARIRYLLELLGPERLTLTDATAAIPPANTSDLDDLSADLLTHSAWNRRVANREAVISAALKAAQSGEPSAQASQVGARSSGSAASRIR